MELRTSTKLGVNGGLREARRQMQRRPRTGPVLCNKTVARRTGAPSPAAAKRHMHMVVEVSDQRGLAKVKDNKIVIRRDWKKDSDKIKGAFAIARDLAAKVRAKTSA